PRRLFFFLALCVLFSSSSSPRPQLKIVPTREMDMEGTLSMDVEKVVTDVSETPTVEEGKDMVETMATMTDQDLELLRLKQRIR
ncbi:unnamed protein product, partial [Prunus brigantina]